MTDTDTVAVRLKKGIIKDIDANADNRSEFIREAILEKLDRPTVNSRVEQNRDEIEQLRDEISEIRSALIQAADADAYRDYGDPRAGDDLDEPDE